MEHLAWNEIAVKLSFVSMWVCWLMQKLQVWCSSHFIYVSARACAHTHTQRKKWSFKIYTRVYYCTDGLYSSTSGAFHSTKPWPLLLLKYFKLRTVQKYHWLPWLTPKRCPLLFYLWSKLDVSWIQLLFFCTAASISNSNV